jgi:hypothetical protein
VAVCRGTPQASISPTTVPTCRYTEAKSSGTARHGHDRGTASREPDIDVDTLARRIDRSKRTVQRIIPELNKQGGAVGAEQRNRGAGSRRLPGAMAVVGGFGQAAWPDTRRVRKIPTRSRLGRPDVPSRLLSSMVIST